MTGTRSSFVLVAVLAAQALWLSHSDAQTGGDKEPGGDVSLRQRAEDLARAASKRFTEILSREEGTRADGEAPDNETLDPVWDWLGQAARAYRGVIVTKLKDPSGEIAILTPPGATPPKLPTAPAAVQEPRAPEPQLGWTYLVESLREWLARANRSYRTEIVKKLVAPQVPEPMQAAEPARDAAPAPAPRDVAAAPKADLAGDGAAKPAAPDVESKPAVIADAKQPSADEANAERRAEAEAEAKREADREAKRQAEAEAEAKRKADREAEAEAKRKAVAEAEAKRRADREAKRKAEAEVEAKRKAEREAKRKAEAEVEAKRKAEADAQAERLAEEEQAEQKAVADAKRMAQAPPMPTAPEVAPAPPVRKSPAGGGATPKARAETGVSVPPPPKAEGVRQRVSKSRYAKKRVRRRGRASRHLRARSRMHVEARVKRHHRKAWRKRRRCPKHYRLRHREVRGWSGRVHVVRRGDTLTRIARRYYGTAAGYRTIYRANRHRVRNPNLIYPRQRLYIPSRRR